MPNVDSKHDHSGTGDCKPSSLFVWPSKLLAGAFGARSGMNAQIHGASSGVEKYYHKTGLWQRIACNILFQNVTLLVIVVNAIWLGIDTDYNSAVLPFTDQPIFQIFSNLFCVFFCFEWIVRFGAFEKKTSGMKDPWFSLDTFIILFMVLDTWILPSALYLVQNDGQVIVAPLNLMRLLRLIRLARFFRELPELRILLKGLLFAIRSVFFTIVLLLMVCYVFGIVFCQITAGYVGTLYFSTVPQAMLTLLQYGIMFDNVGVFMDDILTLGFHVFLVFLIFVFLTTFTLLNMLIGVLCSVVSDVGDREKEDVSVSFVTKKFHSLFETFSKDSDDNDTISQLEFNSLMRSDNARQTFSEVGVNPECFADLVEVFFSEQGDVGIELNKELSLSDFMAILLQLRGKNSATVADLINQQTVLRKFVDSRIFRLENRIEDLLNTLDHRDQCPRPSHEGQACRHIMPSSPISGQDTLGSGLPRGVVASDDSRSWKCSFDSPSFLLPGIPDAFLSPVPFNRAASSQEDSLPVRAKNRVGCDYGEVLENRSLSATMQNLEEKCLCAISNDLHDSFQHLKRIVHEILHDEEKRALAVAPVWKPNEAVRLQDLDEGDHCLARAS